MIGKAHRKYNVTTYSGNDMPIIEPVHDRNFAVEHPGEKMFVGITYIPLDGCRRYLAGVMELCDHKK